MFADTKHTMSDFWSNGLMPGTFFFIVCITYLVYWIGRTLYRCMGFAKKEELEDEELVPFFHSITKRQRKEYFKEENECRDKLNFSRLPDSTFGTICEDVGKLNGKMSENKQIHSMTGVHAYNILANPTHYDNFMYMPYIFENRHEYIVSKYLDEEVRAFSVDIVRVVSDLAYIPTSRAK